MNAQNLQRAYIKLLYGGDSCCEASSEELIFIRTHLDSFRLEVEQKARVRNLRTVLHSEMHLLSRYVSKEMLLPVVQRYCADAKFWQHRGRTLLEDFCLFYSQQSEVDSRMRIICEVEGTLSGLSIVGNTGSPWSDHQHAQHGGEESFIAGWYARPTSLAGGLPLDQVLIPSDASLWKFTRSIDTLKLTVEKLL